MDTAAAGESKMDRAWLPLCLGVIFLLSLIPLVHLLYAGAGIQGIAAPAYLDEYYSPLIREVVDGNPFVGNPWFFEHRDDISPRPILPYWISALPLLAGLPLALAVAMNFSLWSLTFGLILYFFFRRFGLPPAWSGLGAIYIYIQTYTFLLRPVSMQLVYPAFLLLILVFSQWWKQPEDRYRSAFLGLTAALTFYMYGFLYQISVVFLGLVFIFLLYQRDWKRVVHALIVGAWTGVLIIPFIITTLAEVNDPHYLEAMMRTGLVFTHSLNVLGARQAVAAITFISSVYLASRWIFRTHEYGKTSSMVQFLLLGPAIVIVSLSNVITGMDAETSNHMARFFNLWLILSSIVIAYALFTARRQISQLTVPKKIMLSIFVIFVLYLNNAFPLTPLTASFLMGNERAAIQEDNAMLPALQWLDAQSLQPHVVWIDPHNSRLNSILPIYTKHYELLGNDGVMQLVSSDEVEERYLVASATTDVTEKSIAADIWLWGFGGYAIDTPNTKNREVHQCTLLHLYLLGISCGQSTDASKLYAPLVASMYARYTRDIQPHLGEELKKFHVTYIIKDTQTDTQFHPERLKNVQQVYSDGRYLIYKVI